MKRKQAEATRLNPSEKIAKLDLLAENVSFGEGASSQMARWEHLQKAKQTKKAKHKNARWEQMPKKQ